MRGRGLLLGLELKSEALPIVERCRERGLLVSAVGGSIVRFAPPLTVAREELSEAMTILDAVLS